MEEILDQLQEAIEKGETQKAMNKTKDALNMGLRTDKIIKTAINPAFRDLGQKMFDGEIYVTDVLMASRAAHAAMYVMEPIISRSTGQTKGIVTIGTVAGDLHDIGKNLVIMMLQGSGYTVIDLGIDVPVEDFVEAIRTHKPDVLALSSLLTTTLPELDATLEALVEAGLRSQVKVIVGGAPVTREYAARIKADAYANDLFEASEAVGDLVKNRIGVYAV
ncbi:MAG: methyltransferase [Acetobacterium sp. MES1]|uniref:Cobalamin-binding protein n=1 Tax=Acetobacterium wieringae TaxID=52694 RepID=A0A5D0WJ85_9FIRM|nr:MULTISPECIES: cobalamin-dependent protein [Acetobacterium]OXS26775.1 MAG: methyltransferase [Acetobacterium sp. MES1]TYC84322.1 cobalamin-binding protein [Acetobacterium wieringae]